MATTVFRFLFGSALALLVTVTSAAIAKAQEVTDAVYLTAFCGGRRAGGSRLQAMALPEAVEALRQVIDAYAAEARWSHREIQGTECTPDLVERAVRQALLKGRPVVVVTSLTLARELSAKVPELTVFNPALVARSAHCLALEAPGPAETRPLTVGYTGPFDPIKLKAVLQRTFPKRTVDLSPPFVNYSRLANALRAGQRQVTCIPGDDLGLGRAVFELLVGVEPGLRDVAFGSTLNRLEEAGGSTVYISHLLETGGLRVPLLGMLREEDPGPGMKGEVRFVAVLTSHRDRLSGDTRFKESLSHAYLRAAYAATVTESRSCSQPAGAEFYTAYLLSAFLDNRADANGCSVWGHLTLLEQAGLTAVPGISDRLERQIGGSLRSCQQIVQEDPTAQTRAQELSNRAKFANNPAVLWQSARTWLAEALAANPQNQPVGVEEALARLRLLIEKYPRPICVPLENGLFRADLRGEAYEPFLPFSLGLSTVKRRQ